MKTLLCLLLVAAPVFAQPMMLDPSKMSGIPRPDPQVPANTITVRLIRGELTNRVVAHEVELVSDGKLVKTEKTDENGRATFSALSGGPFIARAKDGDDELTSQPIELPGDTGVRVMLVFKNNQPGAPDGVGRPDKSLPSGTVIVRAVAGDGGILPGLEVKLGQVRAGESQVVEHKGKTDDKGEAHFTGLDAKPTSGYLAEVVKDGTRYAGKPFRMPDNMGVLVVVQVNPVTKDLSALQIGQGSHLIFQITDDAVQVVEVWRLQNSGSTAVEIPGGLHFPLPDDALQAAPGQGAPPNFSVVGHDAVWKGPLPPGDSEVQVMFVLAVKGETLEFAQRTPLAFAETAIVTEKIDNFSVDGNGLEHEERSLQGRQLMLYRGPGATAGGELRLHLLGLPRADARWRYAAAVLTVLLLIGFGIYAASGDGGVSEKRRTLEAKRETLLDELVALEKKPEDAKRNKRRDELKEKLAQLYRDLDQIRMNLEARQLIKVYGRQRALGPVDLTLRPGEVTALLGPNGAGKSTLIGILATLVTPSSGEVLYGGRELDEDLRGTIGVIAHESLCYADLSGRENLEFFARLYRVAQPKQRAAALIERVGLTFACDRPARTYSRGMLQRLALGRALVHRPKVLLADEPFTGLDRAGVELLGQLLAEERAAGALVVVVTHDFDAVAQVVDRVVVLHKGRIAHDAPAPPARQPASLAEVYRAALR